MCKQNSDIHDTFGPPHANKKVYSDPAYHLDVRPGPLDVCEALRRSSDGFVHKRAAVSTSATLAGMVHPSVIFAEFAPYSCLVR